jgi:thioesterase domain-containing protein
MGILRTDSSPGAKRKMAPAALTAYLHERIPLSRAMAVTVRRADSGGVMIEAPLAANVNHRDTVFGGSASALGILAAWSALFVRLQAEGVQGRIVIRRNTMSYEKPITAQFSATAAPPRDAAWARLLATLSRRRMARARVTAVLECLAEPVGKLEAEFAVLPPEMFG